MRKLFYLVLLSLFMITVSYACTGITKTVNGKTLYGANMDWNNPYAHIRFIPGEKDELGIAIISHEEHNYSQGINEAGLAIDHFMVPYNRITKNKDKEFYDGDLVIGVLKNCSTVDEAIAMLNEYNFSYLLSEFQLLITDKNGDSVIFEGDTILRKKNDYQVATNFLQSKVKTSNTLCPRYKIAEEILEDSNLNVKVFEEILDKVKVTMLSHSTTIYSYIYI